MTDRTGESLRSDEVVDTDCGMILGHRPFRDIAIAVDFKIRVVSPNNRPESRISMSRTFRSAPKLVSDRKKRSVWFWVRITIFLVFVGYPLSIGPFGWLFDHGYLSPFVVDALTCLYAPLRLMARSFDFIGVFINWYSTFWK